MNGAAGRGRGRAQTLPAWMTKGDVKAPAAGAGGVPVAPTPQPVADKPPASSPAPAATAGKWTEHTAPDGRKYYYNATTKVSKWTMPADYEPAKKKPAASPTPAHARSQWKEFTSDKGRKYYYNSVTKESRWERPKDMDPPAGGAAAPPNPAAAAPPAADATARAKAAEKANAALVQARAGGGASQVTVQAAVAAPAAKAVVYANHAEATKAFKELLSDRSVGGDWTWEQTMKAIINDPRYSALKTVREKKTVFSEYAQERRKVDKEERQKRERKARADFSQLLIECKDLETSMSYRKAVSFLEDDPRFEAVTEEEDRQEAFEEHMQTLEQTEREKRRSERKQKMTALSDVLYDRSDITLDTTWRKAQDLLSDEAPFVSLDPLDRLTVFEAHVRHLMKKKKDQDGRKREEERRQERRNRDAFRQLLKEALEKGEIHVRTKWKTFAGAIKEDPRFLAMVGQDGSTPRELYDDEIDILKDLYHDDKKMIKELIKGEEEFTVTADTTAEQVVELLEKHKRKVKRDKHVGFVIEDIVEKAARKKEKEERRKKEREERKEKGKDGDTKKRRRDDSNDSRDHDRGSSKRSRRRDGYSSGEDYDRGRDRGRDRRRDRSRSRDRDRRRRSRSR